MMNDSTANQTVRKISFAKVILCVILLLSAMALTVELIPADTQVGVTASAATKEQLKNKQAQLQSQQKSISAKLSKLKKSKAAVDEAVPADPEPEAVPEKKINYGALPGQNNGKKKKK